VAAERATLEAVTLVATIDPAYAVVASET